MQNKYNELVKVIKDNDIRLEKDEFKIVNQIINIKNTDDEYYEHYFELSDKAQAVAKVFTFGDINPNELTQKCYVVNEYEVNKSYYITKRTIRLAKNKSQLLHIFLNKSKNSKIYVKIMEYVVDEYVLRT